MTLAHPCLIVFLRVLLGLLVAVFRSFIRAFVRSFVRSSQWIMLREYIVDLPLWNLSMLTMHKKPCTMSTVPNCWEKCCESIWPIPIKPTN